MRHPDRLTAIITQNDNAYLDGLGKRLLGTAHRLWALPTLSTTNPKGQVLLPFLQPGLTKWQFTNGVPEEPQCRIAPGTYTLDAVLLTREGAAAVQLSLFYDYGKNLKPYSRWQDYLRTTGVPMLVLLGAMTSSSPKQALRHFRRDVNDMVVDFVDSGHFALEAHVECCAEQIDKFLSPRVLKAYGQ